LEYKERLSSQKSFPLAKIRLGQTIKLTRQVVPGNTAASRLMGQTFQEASKYIGALSPGRGNKATKCISAIHEIIQ
jgi:hypothetical protein